MKAKDVGIYKLYSDTFKGRKMFGFMDLGELSRMDKVSKPIIQIEKNKKGNNETIQNVTDTCK